MMKEVLINRINELKNAVDNSANQHNALVGRLVEATHILQEMINAEEAKKEEEKQAEEKAKLEEVKSDEKLDDIPLPECA